MRTEAEIQAKIDELNEQIDAIDLWHLPALAIKVCARRMLEWVLEAPAEVEAEPPRRIGHIPAGGGRFA
jgi:hypothetical protein